MKTQFCKRIKEYIAEERKAGTRDYPSLRKIAPAEAKKRIGEIGRQERGHRKILIGLWRKYCGGK